MYFYYIEKSAFIFLNASVLSCIFYFTLKFLRNFFSSENNSRFYNNIVKCKKVFIINDINTENDLITTIDAFTKVSKTYISAGFDCEWPPNQNISLIQIAFPDGCCFLIRLLKTDSTIPIEILNWMKDASKLKFGIGVLEDGKKLENQWNVNLRGCVDLRHLAVRLKTNGLNTMGLKSFGLNWLDLNYPYDDKHNKVLSVQCSDWSQEMLSAKQIDYAALDGLVGALCPVEFLCRKLSMKPSEALSNLNSIRSYSQGCIDLRFKSKIKSQLQQSKSPSTKSATKLACYNRVSPIYDNTVLLTPDGEMLSRLSKKKAEWYLKRELGVKVSDDPLVVQLLFEPSGRASGENDYYIQEKENLCVVCGCRDGCVKKNIIPIEYRRHYPVSHKSHKSHDVLPLCVACHQTSNIIDDQKKKELAVEFEAPLGSRETVLNKTDFSLSRVKNAARALLHQNKIPEARVKELQSIVAQFYELDPTDENIPEKILSEAVKLEIATQDGQFVSHGRKVVSTLDTPTSLVTFEVMWREHFVEKMQPKYLPVGWSTHHRTDRYCNMNME